jgi:hypothetical protein
MLGGLSRRVRSRFPAGLTERKAKARAKQIPFGNDRKKSKGKSKRRFPSGMTKEEQEQTQIPFGNDKQNRE